MVGKGFSIKLHRENNSTSMRETGFREIIVTVDDRRLCMQTAWFSLPLSGDLLS